MTKTGIALLLSAILVLGSSLAASAETRWGPTIGINYNVIHFKQGDIFKSDRMIGGQAGLTGELMVPGIGFGVDGSVLYSLRQGKLHLGDKKVWASQGAGTETCSLHYIDVPLNLKFKYHNLNGVENTIMPMVFVGPTISFLAGHNKCADQLSYQKVSASLHFGLGCELFNKVQVKAGYQFSIGSSLKTKLLDENDAKNRSWFCNVTYFLK